MAWYRCCVALLLAAATIAGQDVNSATPQRPTFTNDASTTVPGTVELEMGGLFAESMLSIPTSLKFSPKTGNWFEGTELSLGFDGLVSTKNGAMRITQFGDTLNLNLRRRIWRKGDWAFALAPQFGFLLRGDKGARLGAKGIAVYAPGLNGIAVNLTWTAATQSSASNPAQKYDVAAGYSRQIGRGSLSERFSLFAEYQREMPSNADSTTSLIQGMAFRARPSMVFDIAVSQVGVGSGNMDVQLAAGLTVNLGRIQSR